METVFHDVTLQEKLAYQNVVSSRARFHYSEMAEHLDSFASRIAAKGYDPKGPFFYSLNNVPMDEIVDIEMFLPIHQNTFNAEEGLLFHSYFEVSPLLGGIVKGDFENETERVYAQLLATLEANDLGINSPVYHVLQQDVPPYACVFVGYVDPEEMDDSIGALAPG
jgi:effector-binding domain-containing protein